MKAVSIGINVLLLMVITLSACNSSANTVSKNGGDPVITEGVMTTAVDNDSKPTAPVVISFDASVPVIYCSFKVSGVAPEEIIKASWYYVGGEAEGKENELLNETFTITESDATSYYLAFYLDKPASGWYKGDYKVVLSVNNVEKLAVPFSIE